MRLFVAVPVVGETCVALSEQVAALHPMQPDGVRWIPPENWHMTVLFLGDGFSRTQADALAEAVEGGLPDLSAFEVPLERIDWFPSAQKPVVLAALVERNLMLQALHDEVYQALKGCEGVKKPQYRFMPHISLARCVRQKIDLQNFGGIPLEQVWLPVEDVVLYRSHFTSHGVRYEPLARGRLA